jgi:hypothetical protein
MPNSWREATSGEKPSPYTVANVETEGADKFHQPPSPSPSLVVALEYLPAADHHVRPPTNTLLGNGSTDTTVNSRTRMKSPVTAQGSAVRVRELLLSRWCRDRRPVSLVLRAAIETSTGEFIPMFFAGKRDVTIDPDAALVWSDPTGFDVKRNDIYWVRTFVTMGSTHTCVSTFRAGGREGGVDIGEGSALNGTDLTTSSTIAASSFSFLYGPVRVRGKAKSRRVQDAARRHRRQHRRGHRPADLPEPAVLHPARPERQLRLPDGGVGLGRLLQLARHHAGQAERRMALLTDCTDIYCAQGVNDIGTTLGSPDLPTMQNLRAIPVWNTFFNRGKRVWAHTITPRVTSSTGYGTLGAQTTTGNDQVRVAFNNWLRDGAPMLAGAAAATGSNAAGTVRIGSPGHPLAGSSRWPTPSSRRATAASGRSRRICGPAPRRSLRRRRRSRPGPVRTSRRRTWAARSSSRAPARPVRCTAARSTTSPALRRRRCPVVPRARRSPAR